MTKDDEIEKNMNGYSETEQMLKNYTANVQVVTVLLNQ